MNTSGTVVQQTDYYPFGMDIAVYNGGLDNKYRYNGKEFQEDVINSKSLSWYDYGARFYDPTIGRWHSADPLADQAPEWSPYRYGFNNPIKFTDPSGILEDWVERDKSKKIEWDDKVTSKNDKDLQKGDKYLGKAVAVFNGSTDEKLGKGQNLFGEGAKLADVTVYGPKGADDIKSYKGFSMTSNPSKFGVVADGDYTVNRLAPDDRKGPYGSDLVIESRDAKIPEQDNFNPAYPNRNPAYLQGVFIHRSNNDGWAGWKYDANGNLRAVSEGCLLIAPNQWNQFHSQLNGVNSLLLQLRRK